MKVARGKQCLTPMIATMKIFDAFWPLWCPRCFPVFWERYFLRYSVCLCCLSWWHTHLFPRSSNAYTSSLHYSCTMYFLVSSSLSVGLSLKTIDLVKLSAISNWSLPSIFSWLVTWSQDRLTGPCFSLGLTLQKSGAIHFCISSDFKIQKHLKSQSSWV